MKISKGYENYSKRDDCIGKRFFILLYIKQKVGRYYHLLDIDFGYYSLKRFWIEIVFLGIGFSYDVEDKSKMLKRFRFRNDYTI